MSGKVAKRIRKFTKTMNDNSRATIKSAERLYKSLPVPERSKLNKEMIEHNEQAILPR